MFKVVTKRGNKYGVIDTTDGVLEYFTYNELQDFVINERIDIDGCVCCEDANNYHIYLVVYLDSDILFKGNKLLLVKNKSNNCIYLIRPEYYYQGLYRKVASCIWISDKNKVCYRLGSKGDKVIISAKEAYRGIDLACKTSKEIMTYDTTSLFIDFGTVILEFFFNSFEDNWLKGKLMEL